MARAIAGLPEATKSKPDALEPPIIPASILSLTVPAVLIFLH